MSLWEKCMICISYAALDSFVYFGVDTPQDICIWEVRCMDIWCLSGIVYRGWQVMSLNSDISL